MAVVPLWHPQWLHQELELRELADPLGLLGGQDDATLVLTNEAAKKLSDDGLAFLRQTTLGNAVVSQLDHLVCRKDLSFKEAAKTWLNNRV